MWTKSLFVVLTAANGGMNVIILVASVYLIMGRVPATSAAKEPIPASSITGSPRHAEICSTWTSVYREHHPRPQATDTSVFKFVDYVVGTIRKVDDWHSTEMSLCSFMGFTDLFC